MTTTVKSRRRRTMDNVPVSLGWIGWFTLLGTWLFQLAWPQLAYPEYGMLQITLLIGLLALAASRVVRVVKYRRAIHDEKSPSISWFHHAAQMGVILLVYVWIRWGLAGFPAAGVQNVVSLYVTAAYAGIAYLILLYTYFASEHSTDPHRSVAWQVMLFCGAFCAAMVVCAIHAFVQYYYLYDVRLAELKAQFSGQTLTASQEALLNHFAVRRVASVFGDPNSLGAFAAMSLAAAIQLMRMRWRTAWGWLGGISGLLALATIALTGSRGAVLDALLVVLIYAWAFRRRDTRREQASLPVGTAAIVIIMLSVFTFARPLIAEVTSSSLVQSLRINTVMERINYWQVGREMISQRPWLGHGPGSVEYMFGQFKPETARETRFLHNWVLQMWAEYGWFGFSFTAGFFAILFYNTRRANALRLDSVFFGPAVICAVFCFDALIQHSVYQRELMATFAMAAGMLLFAGAYSTRPTKAGQVRNLIFGVTVIVLGLLVHGLTSLYVRGKIEMASDLMQAGEFAESGKQLEQAQRVGFNDHEIYLMQSYLANVAGDSSGSLRLLSKAIEAEPRSASLRVERAVQLNNAGQRGAAWDDLNAALQRYPSHPDNLNLAALWSLEDDQVSSATEYARRAVVAGQGLSKEGAYRATLQRAEAATSPTLP